MLLLNSSSREEGDLVEIEGEEEETKKDNSEGEEIVKEDEEEEQEGDDGDEGDEEEEQEGEDKEKEAKKEEEDKMIEAIPSNMDITTKTLVVSELEEQRGEGQWRNKFH